jgi:UPF0755 protein
VKIFKLLLLLFVSVFALTVFVSGCVPGDGEERYVKIEVKSGDSVASIVKSLKREGIIRSEIMFKRYLSKHNLDKGLKPGSYVISINSSYEEIAATLSEGKESVVTIPEGYTVSQIDLLLFEMDLIEEGELLKCSNECDFSSFDHLLGGIGNKYAQSRLEGYLFPDTYYVNPVEFVPKFFIERMLGNFEAKAVSQMNLADSRRSVNHIVTMASLIERETSSDDEREIVSGILWKRLSADQGLAVDATVRYALGKITEALTKDDLSIDSAYNTRKYRGLPPGPIANPGLKSIKAAINPKDSPYFYYLHGKDGQIRYSETNDEHNLKKAKYL